MRIRILLVTLALGLWAGGVLARLVQLQVVDHPRFAAIAQGQQQEEIVLAPPRGTIFDARGRELAVSVEVESAFADPGDPDFPGVAELVRRVGEVLPQIDRVRLRRRLEAARHFAWVARQLDPPQARALRSAAIPGLSFLPEHKRYYPLRELAAPVLGLVGLDHEGLGGLEYQYEGVIAGEPVRRLMVKDARGRTGLAPGLEYAEVRPGADLHLTLDASIQHIAERELGAAVERWRAKGGTAVVLEPATGAVLAMASLPSFDPNRFGDFPRERWRNRAVTDPYEPGSTFKLVVASAALEHDLVDPGDPIDCGMGAIRLEHVRINDHKPFGLLPFREVISRSSNVGVIRVAMQVGSVGMHEQIRAFGFGERSGIDLPGESPGILQPLAAWDWPFTTAYHSFGQGLSVTSLQLAGAFAAVAAGGVRHRPHVVAAVGGGAAAERRRPEVVGRPLSAATARRVTRLLEGVTAPGATGQRAAIEGYRVAGKTGTGQKVIPGQGYSQTRVTAGFAGFAPAGDPALVAVVALDEPRGAIHGGVVAAPVFREIVRQSLLYLGVPPEEPREWTWPEPGSDSGPEAAPAASPATAVLAAVGPPPGGAVPDLTGLTARQAVERSTALGLDVRLEGRGFVVRQEPPAGAAIDAAGRGMRLWLGRPR